MTRGEKIKRSHAIRKAAYEAVKDAHLGTVYTRSEINLARIAFHWGAHWADEHPVEITVENAQKALEIIAQLINEKTKDK